MKHTGNEGRGERVDRKQDTSERETEQGQGCPTGRELRHRLFACWNFGVDARNRRGGPEQRSSLVLASIVDDFNLERLPRGFSIWFRARTLLRLRFGGVGETEIEDHLDERHNRVEGEHDPETCLGRMRSLECRDRCSRQDRSEGQP